MTTIATLAVKLLADAAGFLSAMDQAEKKSQTWSTNVSKNLKDVGGKMTNFGKWATLGVTTPIVGAGTAAINMASDLEESTNAVNVMFGQSANVIHEFGKVTATEVGLSTSQFNQLASVTGAFLTNLGYDQASAADETLNLTKRASDMASTFNTDVSTALAAIQSGLKGEFNPLEQFGVKMNAAAIEAKVLTMGLVESAVSMADVERAQSSMGNAQDKWIDLTKKALSNGKITKDQYMQLQQALWGLDEAYNAGLMGTDEWNGAVEDSLDIWRQYSSVLGEDGREALLSYEKGLGSLDQAMLGQTGEITDNMKAQAALALIYEQTDKIAGDFKNTSDGLANTQRQLQAELTNAGAAIGAQLLPYALQLANWARDMISRFQALTPEQQKWLMIILGVAAAIGPVLMVVGSLVTAIGAIIPVVTAVGGVLSGIALPLLLIIGVLALLYFAWTNNWGGIQQKTQAVIEFIKGLIAGGMQFISDLTSGKLGWLSQIWNNTVGGIQALWQLFTTNIKLIGQAFTAAFHGDWYAFGEKLRMVWDNMWTGIKLAAQIAWENIRIFFSNAVTNIINFFRDTDWGQVGRNIIEGIANGLKAAGSWLKDAAINAANNALNAVKGFLGIHSESKVFKRQVGWEMGAGTTSGWVESINKLLMPSFGMLTPAMETVMPQSPAPGANVRRGETEGERRTLELLEEIADKETINYEKLARMVRDAVLMRSQ